MGSFNNRYLSTSPVLSLQPQHPPNTAFNNMISNRPAFSSTFINQSLSPAAQTPSHAPDSMKRKRSRDDAADNLGDDDCMGGPATPPAQENEDEWVYGEGMVLIKPSSGYTMTADSQSGTWIEEQAEAEKQRVLRSQVSERPVLRPAKSQRRDLKSSPSMDLGTHSGFTATPLGSSNDMNAANEPTVDAFTRHLGIGWSMVSPDSDVQAAVRGWTKYIENHFPVSEVTIRLQSRGLASFLIEAREGYFLFGEDLRQGRLVSQTMERAINHLRGPIPTFDSDVILEAGQTPLPTPTGEMTATEMYQQLVMNRNEATRSTNQAQSLDVEMDMS